MIDRERLATLPQVTEALVDRAGRGITTMLPSPDAAWVGAELARVATS